MIAIPFIGETNFILSLWLGNVPEYASVFCQLLLCFYLLEALQAPLWMLIYATGNIKWYSIWSGTLTILNLPLSWIALFSGADVYSVFIIRIAIAFICAILRIIYVNKYVNFNGALYCKVVIPRVFTVSFFLIVVLYISSKLDIHPLINLLILFVTTVVFILTMGVSKKDKRMIIEYINRKRYEKKNS